MDHVTSAESSDIRKGSAQRVKEKARVNRIVVNVGYAGKRVTLRHIARTIPRVMAKAIKARVKG